MLVFAGGLLVVSGAIYNGLSGFSYETRLVENEVTVLPYVPFVIKLQRLAWVSRSSQASDTPVSSAEPKPQEIELVLLQNDEILERKSTMAGHPVHAAGITLLPSDTDMGWVFTLVVRDPGGREKVVPVDPSNPPLVRLGLTRQHVFADSVSTIGMTPDIDTTTARPNAAEIFLVEQNGERQSLGFATESDPVSASGYMVSIWGIRPHVGLHVYHRPGQPMLAAGIVCLLAGFLIAVFAIASVKRKTRSA
jgi:hypothetical protein